MSTNYMRTIRYYSIRRCKVLARHRLRLELTLAIIGTLIVSSSAFSNSEPVLTVVERNLGTWTAVGPSSPVHIEAASGQLLQFEWSADASASGGTIDAYRYGWDLTDPDDDAAWDVDWGADVRSAQNNFANDVHTLHVQALDDMQNITTAEIVITVVAYTGERALLFVDDASEGPGGEEARIDELWLTVLQSAASQLGVAFDEGRDIWDVMLNRDNPPPVSKLFQYAAVIWDVQPGATGSTALADYRFFDPLATRNAGAPTFNLLQAYLNAGGKLWICGFQAAKQLWPPERQPRTEGDPVNVTNWDDPIEPHPDADSTGTTSLVYQMGVEMFDVGANIVTNRRTLEHFCQGLRTLAAAAPNLSIDPLHWLQPPSQPSGMTGRPNIEIYNMPEAMSQQVPPLVPPPGKVDVLYSYASGVPRDDGNGIVYPQTADGQAVFLAAKTLPTDAYAASAICGFRPHLLTAASHAELVRYVLRHEFGVAPVSVLLQNFAIRRWNGSVHIDWRLAAAGDPAEFVLIAAQAARQWTVPHRASGHRTFTAIDDAVDVRAAGVVTYSLFQRSRDTDWTLLWRQSIEMSLAPGVVRLAPAVPNPFNPRTRIDFELGVSDRTVLEVFRLDGRKVSTLLDEVRPPGSGSVVWDGTDARGRAVTSGHYIVRLRTSGIMQAQKLVLLR